MPKGNLNLPQVGEKGEEMELVGFNYLKEQGYQIIHGGTITRMESRQRRKKHEKIKLGKYWSSERHKKFKQIESLQRKLGIVTRQNYGIYDCLCKKGKQYFLFEIKYKIWKEGRPNFNSSERQIWHYNRIQKAGKAKVKVLVITKKDQLEKQTFHIYDWDDFEQTKTTIKLKNKNPIKLKNKSHTKDSPSLAKLLKSMMIDS